MSRLRRTFAVPALTLCLGLRSLAAQGITSAAVEGVVARADGAPIGGATVRVTDAASGARWQVATDDAGRYFLENVQVGGPYVVDAIAVGFRPARRASVVLALGQRYRADFVLEPNVVTLGAVTVTATADALRRAARTGPEYVVTEATIEALPNVSRDISAAVALAPLAVLRPLGGVSIGGQNQGYNSLQVDGGVNADLYLGRTPGGASPSAALPEVLPHTISIETVREVQVLASPFDVRFGGFAGGLLNVVTRSGTNSFDGSLFGFVQDGRLAARGPAGRRLVYTTRQFGGTLSGPIVRDRIHFFVNADVQQRVVPDAGPLVTDTGATRIPYDSALRFQNILRSEGLDPGSLGPDDAHLPAQDLFAKITMQLGDAGHLELSQRYAHADRSGFLDVAGRADTVPLSSVSGRSRSTARTSRAIWTTLVGRRVQSEAIVSYERLWDSCQPNGTLPRIQVQLFATAYLIAGPNGVCPTTAVDQSALELTENLTVGAGRHLVTVGSHAELLHFRDPLVQVSAGRWFFSSLAALEAGTANHYDRGLPSAARFPSGARFHAITIGIYAQDRWTATSRLTLTPGLRLDVPFLPDAVATNPGLEQSLGIDTGRLPTGNMLWSPRVGIKYDVGGRRATILRGGIGLFSGPPPYRWLGNAYRESGDESVVMCDGNITPTFVPGGPQDTTCTNGKGMTPRISYFDPGFKLPQNLKLAIGADRDVGAGVKAALDFLYTRALHQIYINDPNLGAPIGIATGEGGRLLYGTIDTAGKSFPRWRDTAFGEIYRVSNRSGDESISLSAQLQKSFGEVLSLQASYAWSRARDRMSLVNFPSRANFSNTPLDGSLDGRRLRPSFFETPHKVSLDATLTAPHGLQLALLYLGASQPPYTYVVRGDVNADGIGVPGSLNNDIVYVPKNAAPGGDIDLVRGVGAVAAADSDYARLEEFIERQPCLREQRGRIMKRGSCRNGWLDLLNARVSETVSGANGHRIEIIADIFNLPNLTNSRWGRHRDVTIDPSIPLLRLRKYDTTLGRGRYELETLNRGSVDNTASRWQVQLGVRYSF